MRGVEARLPHPVRVRCVLRQGLFEIPSSFHNQPHHCSTQTHETAFFKSSNTGMRACLPHRVRMCRKLRQGPPEASAMGHGLFLGKHASGGRHAVHPTVLRTSKMTSHK